MMVLVTHAENEWNDPIGLFNTSDEARTAILDKYPNTTFGHKPEWPDERIVDVGFWRKYATPEPYERFYIYNLDFFDLKDIS